MSGVKVDTIHPGSLTKIPSFDIVTLAISMLCKKRECVSSNSFLYIKFSFGVLDINGLKELLKHHQYLKMLKTNYGHQNVNILVEI